MPDKINPGLGLLVINGTDGDDRDPDLTGTLAAEWIRGFDGDDVVKAEGGNDVVQGGDGNDDLDGGADSDEVGVRGAVGSNHPSIRSPSRQSSNAVGASMSLITFWMSWDVA